MAFAQDVLNLARSQIGIGENPMGSNRGTPYHAWYGAESQGWQWCAIFVDWVMHHVDPALVHGVKSAYSGDYRAVGRLHGEEVAAPQPGAIAIMDYGDGGITDHIGIVESASGGNMVLIEGNHNNRVERVTRAINGSTRFWYILPKYSAIQQPKPQEDEEEDMVEATVGKAAVIPSYTDTAKGQHCDLAIANQANAVTKVRLFFKRDGGKGDASQDFAKTHTIDIGPELVYRQDVLGDWKVEGAIGVKVEVLSGGPVHIYRNNPRK